MKQPRVHETSVGLLCRIREGESRAWPSLAKLYAPLLRYWFRRFGVRDSDVDDLIQEVWIATGPVLCGYVAGPGRSFRGWLRGIARHKALNYRRGQVRRPSPFGLNGEFLDHAGRIEVLPDADDEALDPEERVENRALDRRVLEHVRSRVEARTWEVFAAVAIDGTSTAKVAGRFDMTSAAVRMVKSRVLSMIRRHLGETLERDAPLDSEALSRCARIECTADRSPE
ncbi:MAG: sigma-70 family RNA polymerase sigma factor [Isosphaeraceae bacterium]|nr:sigma-70 family RNA polymerase sigma factor [Isosphaeraceae bacterium]